MVTKRGVLLALLSLFVCNLPQYAYAQSPLTSRHQEVVPQTIHVEAALSACSSGATGCSFVGSKCLCTKGALDGSKPLAFDIDADGNLEYMFLSGSRFLLSDPDGSSSYHLDEGWGGYTWKGSEGFLFAAARGKYFLAHYGKSSPTYQWGINRLKIRALFNGSIVEGGPSYALGEVVASEPVQIGAGLRDINGDVFISPGSSGMLWHTDGANRYPASYTVSISAAGALSLAQNFQASQSGNYGNGATVAELCNSQECRKLMFATNILDLETGAEVGSWVNANGHPALGYIQFNYGSNHVDSTTVIPFRQADGSERYQVCVTYENGRLVCAEALLHSNPTHVELLPFAADFSSPNCGGGGVGAEAHAHIASIEGLPPAANGYIVNGCLAYRAQEDIWERRDDAPAQFASAIEPMPGFYFDDVQAAVPRGLMDGDVLFSRYYGFAGSSNEFGALALQQQVPTTQSLSNPGTGTRLYAYQRPSGSSGQFSAYSPYHSQYAGIPRALGVGFEIHDLGTGRSKIDFLIGVVNAPNAFSFWKYNGASGFIFDTAKRAEVEAIALAHAQQTSISRGYSSVELHEALRSISAEGEVGTAVGIPYACPGDTAGATISSDTALENNEPFVLTARGFEPYQFVHLAVSGSLQSGEKIANAVMYPDMLAPQGSWFDTAISDASGTAYFYYLPEFLPPEGFVAAQAYSHCPGSPGHLRTTAGLFLDW